MKRLLSGLVFLFGLVSFAQAAGDAAAGAEKVAVCAGCHGADGNSAIANFPKLAGQGEKYLIKQLRDIKSGARSVVEMTGLLDNLSDQDFENIAAFFASKTTTGAAADPELVKKGQAIYRSGNMATSVAACTACHAPTGAGIALAGFPKLAGQHAAYIEAQLGKFRSGERTNDGDARIMRDIAAKLTDAEIKAVASYISGLR